MLLKPRAVLNGQREFIQVIGRQVQLAQALEHLEVPALVEVAYLVPAQVQKTTPIINMCLHELGRSVQCLVGEGLKQVALQVEGFELHVFELVFIDFRSELDLQLVEAVAFQGDRDYLV